MSEAVFIAPVVKKTLDVVSTPTYKQLQYLWKFKSNIRSLSSSMASLERREEINMLIDAAKRNAEVIGPSVEEWVQQAKMMKKEVDEIIQGTTNAQMGCCFNCKCPNLKVRYSLSKKAATKTIEIADHQEKGDFSLVGYPAPIGQRPFTSPLEVFGFESRLLVEKRVIKALLDEKIHVIAVCGMGGVGKTTMVKKIADEIKEEKHFDEIVMIVVSQDHDLIKVQQQLAEKLGQNIIETTLDARADRLHTRLMDKGKKILLIIDDLWKEIDLRAIGIPSEVERKGLRVLLTSRFSRVCTKMDVKEIIEVGVLTNEEGWSLFKKHANISDVDSDVLKGYPRKVADKCQGLPLAIEIIGKTPKDNKHLSDWADALLGLENAQVSETSEDVHDKVYSRIAWSVNHLKSQCMSFLLLCSLFPEDYEIEIEDLVRFAKACDDHRVKLHDVVRDTCLIIASKGENIYLVSHSRLTEWPDKDTYESYTSISLHFDALNELPSGLKCSRLQLLRLSFNDSKIVDIITSFLQATERLGVLNINSSRIELPPQSFQASISLRTLNLHNCWLRGDLSALLQSLVKVEVLSFYNSSYDGKWPKEIAELSNLKSLDFRFEFCGGPKESFPTGILIYLKKLEELYLGGAKLESYEVIREIGSLSNLNTFEIEGTNSDELAVVVENLDVERLLRFSISSSSEQIYRFSRRMIVHDTNIGMLLKPKMNVLLGKVDEHLELRKVTGYINDLVKDFDGGIMSSHIRSLRLEDCEMKYLWNATDSHTRAGVFVELRKLSISGAKHLEELCHGNIPPESFARLEEVTLSSVPVLSCLWGPIKPPCLSNLTTLEIYDGGMVSLFLGSSLKCFTRLRVMKIERCPKLESLVSLDAQTEQNKAVFPELQELHLVHLDSFQTGGEVAEMVFHNLDSLTLSWLPNLRHLLRNLPEGTVAFQNLTILCISNCNSLKHLLPLHIAKMLLNLETLQIHACGELETIVGPEEFSTSNCLVMQEETVAFQKLTHLSISFCPKLKHVLPLQIAKMLLNLETLQINFCNELEAIVGPEEFSSSNCLIMQEGTVAFQNLRILGISTCRNLKHLLPLHIAKVLLNLETLQINFCEELETIVAPEEFSASNCLTMQEGAVAFQKLTDLSISYCPNLKHLLPMHIAKMLLNLETLQIDFCTELETIVGPEEFSASNCLITQEGTVAFRTLTHLSISLCPNLKHLLPLHIVKMLLNLETLKIYKCKKLEAIVGSGSRSGSVLISQEGTVAFRNLRELDISKCGSLRYLLSTSMPKMLVNLKRLHIDSCKELEAIVGIEEISPTEKVSAYKRENVLDQLEYLILSGLPQLRNFGRMFPEGTVSFQKLLTLRIGNCGGLRYLLTPPMVQSVANLREFIIDGCYQMESIIGGEEVDEATTNEVVQFPELCKLILCNLPELRMLCSLSVDLALPSCNDFVIDNCPRMNGICNGNLISPELKHIRFIDGSSVQHYRCDKTIVDLDLETTRKWFKDCELGKRCINCATSATEETCNHLAEITNE